MPTKRLDFQLRLPVPGKKTNIWSVMSGDTILGSVQWWSHWRRYVFFPQQETLFDASCLKEITDFLDEQMRLRQDRCTD